MPDNKVVLNYDGNSFEYPIVESTIGDRGIDISKLRDQTGLITLDLGYKNTEQPFMSYSVFLLC